ncbi:hypothetical protein BDV96DRAFT_607229 [Lophiotrema nucula]|uniref:Uncharacterized protein n=1 Tax=Lophiotrema nucula TaxID=690887 RepID=A0A6A5YHL1_9PLEO|nr:hypothetical protein BDV96DRAFT_607229 [Lophiotrema nucula]
MEPSIPSSTKPRLTNKDIRRVVEVWDFKKEYNEQLAEAIDIGVERLLPQQDRKWESEDERARMVDAALSNIREENGERIQVVEGFEGKPKPKVPQWLLDAQPWLHVQEAQHFCYIPDIALANGQRPKPMGWWGKHTHDDTPEPNAESEDPDWVVIDRPNFDNAAEG